MWQTNYLTPPTRAHRLDSKHTPAQDATWGFFALRTCARAQNMTWGLFCHTQIQTWDVLALIPSHVANQYTQNP